jgi:hypothetical protein
MIHYHSDTVYITHQLTLFVCIDGNYLIIILLFSKCQNKTEVKLCMRENRKLHFRVNVKKKHHKTLKWNGFL